jgi:heme-degrading monooxygenase HmoA
MSVTVVIVTSKPSNVKFYGQQSAEYRESSRAYDAWVESLPGFISHIREETDENTRTYTAVWESIEDYANYFEQRRFQPDQHRRKEYNALNNITSITTESIT